MKKLVMGNFKMNGDFAMIDTYGDTLLQLQDEKGPWTHDLILFPPTPYLNELQIILWETDIAIGAQDCSPHGGQGALTGEVSASFIKDMGCTHVLVGHSERRHKIHESNETVIEKLKRVAEEGLTPVLCIGETKEEYEQQLTLDRLHEQLKDLPDVEMVIAYEPVWAIGTGLTASTDLIAERLSQIKAMLKEGTPVLYGGSVTPDNAAEILALSEVDGVLVGGASLKAEQIDKIARS